MEQTENFVEELFLPFGPPPVLPDIESELKEYIERPDRLPIYQLNNAQCYWPREPDILSLLNYDLAPVGTTIKLKRDPFTGKIGNMVEVDLQGTGETAKNSMSMKRAPGPPAESTRGNSSNILFWPGGFDEPEEPERDLVPDVDFEKNLRTLAKGFKSGIEFEADNHTPKSIQTDETSQVKRNYSQEETETVNLMAVINEEANIFEQWFEAVAEPKSEERLFKDPEVVLPAIDEFPELFTEPEIPILQISDHNRKNARAEWAEQLDVSVAVTDFDKKVPDPAMKFPYELDNFQKQAIIKLEEDCNVFVAAHTSAGKTTVAEYAIALSQRHMTRTIYTSPIKALSNQKFREFKEKFDSVGLITGDLQINQTASCLIMTTEILQSMLYCASEVLRDLEYVIFDEVHYINNEDRGHVWEEIVILLPPNVNMVMLSATVPNPLKFANWVGQIKKRKMYVISTVKRPVPLQHYLYLGTNMKTKDSCYLVLDKDGKFSTEEWRRAYEQKQLEVKKISEKKGTKKFKESKKHNKIPLESIGSFQESTIVEEKKVSLISQKERALWTAFLKYIQEKDKLPVVVFALSRNRCDKTADTLQHQEIQLITPSQKEEVNFFFKNSIKRLKGSDSLLPQVLRMQKLLGYGIGVHHSGILPILKEIVELLFQKGLVKMLFATETFAMGVNMPARTVVFDTIVKFVGSTPRSLSATEYIQMAGRAGRRGHDKTGTVMIICKSEVPKCEELKAIMCGEPQKLKSQFKITYSMVLHLRRLSEAVSVKDMMRRSFKEVSTLIKEKQVRADLLKIEEALTEIPKLTPCQQELGEFYEIAIQYLCQWKIMRPHMLATKRAVKSLTESRVLLVSYSNYYNKLAILLNIDKKIQSTIYKVLLLTNAEENSVEDKCENWYKMIALTKKKLFLPEQVASHEVMVIKDSDILEITNCTIKTDCRCVIGDWEKRQIPRFKDAAPGPTTSTAVQELLRLSLEATSNPDVLLPFTEMVINDIDLKSKEEELKELKQKLGRFLITQADNFEEQFEVVFRRKELEEKRKQLIRELSGEQLRDYPDYQSRLEILKILGYVDRDERITLKGRVALEMGTQELFLTELVFKNILTDWTPPEIAALLSALVFQQRAEVRDEYQSSRLGELKEKMENEFENLEEIEKAYDVSPTPSLNFGLINVVYQWAKAESFANIMRLTDVQEGIIVRCIQQLNETICDVKNAAIIIGNPILKEKMEEASTAIKRDIVFTASLYTQD